MLTIIMDGGQIQHIISDRNLLVAKKVQIIDFDIDGTSDTIVAVPDDDGHEHKAVTETRAVLPRRAMGWRLTEIHPVGKPVPKKRKELTPPDPGDYALAACQLLVDAYAHGKRNGGEIDWSDVDSAWEAAKRALRDAQPPR